MLTVHHISKAFGVQPVLNDVSFSLNDGQHSGLIGPNGCGKTTLLRILTGQEKPDSGTLAFTRPNLCIGYMSQGLEPAPGQTIAGFLDLAIGEAGGLEAEVSRLAAGLARDPANNQLQTQYDHALERLANPVVKPETILAPLGLAGLSPDSPVRHLSGGQKTRLSLAKILLAGPNLLLLDEPTNHLDIHMLEWLESWLNGFKGAALIVSHDRAFLDNTVSNILELDVASHGMKAYPGNYTDYIEHKLIEREHQAQEWQEQQAEIAQLKAAAAHLRGLTRFKKGGKADTGDKFAKNFFMGRATKGVAGRAKHIEDRIEKLLNEQKVERPKPSWQLKLDFGAPQHQSRDVVIAKNLSIGYAQGNPLLTGLDLHIRAGQRIALTGENGAGKTTLVRTIIGTLPPLAGELKVGEKVRLGYMAQEQELLDPKLSGLETIQKVAPFNETEARNFLHFFLFSGDDPLRPSGSYSYGERSRLMLALLVAQGCTFLILDEPINHLDIPSRARFEQALASYKGAVLAVVHDRWFIQNFAENVWVIDNERLQKY